MCHDGTVPQPPAAPRGLQFIDGMKIKWDEIPQTSATYKIRMTGMKSASQSTCIDLPFANKVHESHFWTFDSDNEGDIPAIPPGLLYIIILSDFSGAVCQLQLAVKISWNGWWSAWSQPIKVQKSHNTISLRIEMEETEEEEEQSYIGTLI